MSPGDLLGLVFDHFTGPLEFDDLVGMFAHLWGVHDPPPASEKRARDVHSLAADPAYRMELQRWLDRTLGADPGVASRAAGGPPDELCAPPTRCPRFPCSRSPALPESRQISEALEIAPLEFARLWNLLPLDDLALAALLGVTRQQVINLRKSARERLVRRIGGKYRLL